MQIVTRVRALALACVVLFVIAACGGGPGNSPIKEGGTLVYARDSDPVTLNPPKASPLPTPPSPHFTVPHLSLAA